MAWLTDFKINIPNNKIKYKTYIPIYTHTHMYPNIWCTLPSKSLET